MAARSGLRFKGSVCRKVGGGGLSVVSYTSYIRIYAHVYTGPGWFTVQLTRNEDDGGAYEENKVNIVEAKKN